MEQQHANRFEQRIGVGMVVLAAVCIAISPSTAKIAYQADADPLAVVAVRCVLAWIGIGAFLVATGRPISIFQYNYKHGLLTGTAQVLGSLGLFLAVAHMDVGLAFLIVFFHPFLIAIFEHFRGKTRLTVAHASLILVALGGLALTVSVKFDTISSIGVGAAILGALAAAVMVVSVAEAAKKTNVLSATFNMMAWASLYLVVATLIGPYLDLFEPMTLPTTGIGWLGILGTGVAFTLGYLLFFSGATAIGVSRASVLSIVEPVFAILFAMLLVNEWLTLAQWVGVVLVVGSLALMEMTQTRS